jgi:nucleolin
VRHAGNGRVQAHCAQRVLANADRIAKTNVTRPAGCRSVFVKNIPYDTTEADMTQAFMVCGPITNVRLAVWGNTKQLKGFGYVDFKREDSAEIAVKKSGQLAVKGRPVIIDFETGAPKKSFKKVVVNK